MFYLYPTTTISHVRSTPLPVPSESLMADTTGHQRSPRMSSSRSWECINGQVSRIIKIGDGKMADKLQSPSKVAGTTAGGLNLQHGRFLACDLVHGPQPPRSGTITRRRSWPKGTGRPTGQPSERPWLNSNGSTLKSFLMALAPSPKHISISK